MMHSRPIQVGQEAGRSKGRRVNLIDLAIFTVPLYIDARTFWVFASNTKTAVTAGIEPASLRSTAKRLSL